MDTRTHQGPNTGQQVDVNRELAEIKAQMPETYRAIQSKATEIGPVAFALVRRGLRGEANCFYALERGWVKGTPFNVDDVNAELARYMVQFGCKHLVMWAPAQTIQQAPAP